MKCILLYIDPGVGSIIAQTIVAGIAAVAVFFKNHLRSIFSRPKKKEKQAGDHHSAS